MSAVCVYKIYHREKKNIYAIVHMQCPDYDLIKSYRILSPSWLKSTRDNVYGTNVLEDVMRKISARHNTPVHNLKLEFIGHRK